MSRRRLGGLVPFAGLLALAACSPGGTRSPDETARLQEEAAYLAAPRVDRADFGPGGYSLEGRAARGAEARLASPGGGGVTVRPDAEGRWRLTVPVAGDGAIFGLSETFAGRTVQAEGYLFLSPQHGAWLLRAGAGARAVSPGAAAPIVLDTDRAGGTVVSGRAAQRGLVGVQLNGSRMGEGRADDAGVFEIRLKGPAPPGANRLRIFGDGISAERTLNLSPTVPPVGGPLRVTPQGTGLRIDWLTPGGGVQSTQILP